MTSTLLKAKLHHIRVTQADLNYQGSLTLDQNFIDAARLHPYEKILVADMENGNRFETYIIPGAPGSRICCLNGAVAHLSAPGHRLIVMIFCELTPEEIPGHRPTTLRFDANNTIIAEAY